MLDARCPGCGVSIRVPEKLIDRDGRCDRCDAEFHIRDALIASADSPPKTVLDARCPSCGASMHVPAKLIDRDARCDRCKAEFRIREAVVDNR